MLSHHSLSACHPSVPQRARLMLQFGSSQPVITFASLGEARRSFWSRPRLRKAGSRDFTVRFRYDLLNRPCSKVRSLQSRFEPASTDTVTRVSGGLGYGSNQTILPMGLSPTGVQVSIAAFPTGIIQCITGAKFFYLRCQTFFTVFST